MISEINLGVSISGADFLAILVGVAGLCGAWYRMMHTESWWKKGGFVWSSDPWARWVSGRVEKGATPPTRQEVIRWSLVQMAGGIVIAVALGLVV
jgi:hypothetical protein